MGVARDHSGRRRARLVRERLPGQLDGVAAAGWLRGEPRGVALSGAWLGGATILSSHPLVSVPPDADPFAALDSVPVVFDPNPDVAVGGAWLGWLGFGLAGAVEPVPPAPPRPATLLPFDLAFHDHVVLQDSDGRWWFEALWTDPRAEVLSERLECWGARLASRAPTVEKLPAAELKAAGASLTGHSTIVGEAVERIAVGELSQANLCLRLETPFDGDPLDLWRTAAAASRPGYAAYVAPDSSGHAVVSLSPELFLRRAGRQVITRPIKGTAPLSSDPAALTRSEKDRAENVMIVDLMRNDLGRVCRYGSVAVEELCALRRAPGVWQLESTVRGELRPGVTDAGLLRATFPPGSVTGAPKVHALRTIHGLETTAREAYCGSVGLCSPLAGLELNVAIRTLELARGTLWLGVGGGIVSDSSPEAEVAEALVKAHGVASAAGLAIAGQPKPASPAGIPFNRAERPDPAIGVLETIRVTQGQAARLVDHLKRLSASCAELGLSVPDQLEAEIAAGAAELTEGALQVTVSSSGTRLTTRPLPAPRVMELVPVTLPGGLGDHKWADRRLIEAHSRPGATPLICDSDGSVLEAGYAAVLLVRGERILAPPRDSRMLPSISREHLLRAVAQGGWQVCLCALSLADLDAADAIVLSSSLRDPHPGRLTGRRLAPRATELCQALARAVAPGQTWPASAIARDAAASAGRD